MGEGQTQLGQPVWMRPVKAIEGVNASDVMVDRLATRPISLRLVHLITASFGMLYLYTCMLPRPMQMDLAMLKCAFWWVSTPS
jgi:hypothetical protein